MGSDVPDGTFWMGIAGHLVPFPIRYATGQALLLRQVNYVGYCLGYCIDLTSLPIFSKNQGWMGTFSRKKLLSLIREEFRHECGADVE